MTGTTESQIAIVTGDVTMDWNLARLRRSEEGGEPWKWDECTRACWQPGGAALLADVVEAVAKSLRGREQGTWEVRQTDVDRKEILPSDRRFHHSYAMWSRFDDSWRVKEFLGVDRCPKEEAPGPGEWRRVVDDTPEAQLVILDDADLGFRDHPELWPQAITAEGCRCPILVKMAYPVAEGALWQTLQDNCAERLFVIMTVNDLRRTEVQISRELSWERTAQDLFWELVYNRRVKALSRCAAVVVSFGPAGAVLLDRQQVVDGAGKTEEVHRCRLFFDPEVIEGMWVQDHPGGMIGYNTCLAAGITRQLMLNPQEPQIEPGIQAGLAATRLLHLEGYGPRDPGDEFRLAFPTAFIAGKLEGEAGGFAVVDVQDPTRFLTQKTAGEKPLDGGFWTILQGQRERGLDKLAERIVSKGLEAALTGVPLGRFGYLLTVDRHEIEAYRSIRSLVNEYCRGGQQVRPLSIAVFGTPGSGKSFGITQVAESLLPGQLEKLEFNLSQFDSTEDLLDALHQVRDVGLSGQIPLVFWDEFDTMLGDQPLGWLRYFLAPMQDGRFQQGQITHPIGRAIFVFAGGTRDTMEEFDEGRESKAFREVKGPDFVSRLKGFVNIMGPKRREQVPDGNPFYIIRRAIIFRSLVERNAPQLIEVRNGREVMRIDPGVRRAFLKTWKYKHGARSMESILAMSSLAGKTAYEQSSLPAAAQMELHVHARDFVALVQWLELDDETLDKLARAVHEVFCEKLREDGYCWGPENDDDAKTSTALVDYDELPPEEQAQNEGNARDIQRKLALAGYVMMPARSDEPPFDFPGKDLEMLAEREHERWMEAKLRTGWKPAPVTKKHDKLHKSLVRWEDLEEVDQEKDRDLVREIPRILARVGYTVKEVRG